jgi:hypothetical protein
MKTFITALALVIALASGLSMIALAFRADFREPATDNGGVRTTWEWQIQNSLPYHLAPPHSRRATARLDAAP